MLLLVFTDWEAGGRGGEVGGEGVIHHTSIKNYELNAVLGSCEQRDGTKTIIPETCPGAGNSERVGGGVALVRRPEHP